MISLLPAVVDNANASARNYALVYSLRYITCPPYTIDGRRSLLST